MPSNNILICGTPGTGKTSLAGELAQRTGWRHINVSELVKERQLHTGFDEEFQSYVIDEDRVLDEMEDASDININGGGRIVEYHGCDFFPERFFSLVIVLSTDNTILWDRLQQRGYSQHKIQENVQAEIMKILLAEAQESYPEEIVKEVPSNTPEDMENSLAVLEAWIAEHAQ
eukprot:m.238284 g.238284  ORF g.238284 m.238284 type:complete len:173 (-) comp13279_c0_seq1:167-685(-)